VGIFAARNRLTGSCSCPAPPYPHRVGVANEKSPFAFSLTPPPPCPAFTLSCHVSSLGRVIGSGTRRSSTDVCCRRGGELAVSYHCSSSSGHTAASTSSVLVHGDSPTNPLQSVTLRPRAHRLSPFTESHLRGNHCSGEPPPLHHTQMGSNPHRRALGLPTPRHVTARLT
jgi:hypothetical protein